MQKLSLFCRTLKPTAFHRALQLIAKQGRLQRVYSQNIDGLEEVAGLSVFPFTCPSSLEAQVIALHGSVRYLAAIPVKCIHQRYHRSDEVTDELLQCGQEPPCPDCRHQPKRHYRAAKMGALTHAVLCFGEESSITDAIKAAADKDKDSADLVVVVGTAMSIKGVQILVSDLLSSAKSPKCMIIDLRKITKASIPRIVYEKATILQLDCQLLAEQILQDSITNSSQLI
jgi:NAD+-dependent protein deacetylase SIR2